MLPEYPWCAADHRNHAGRARLVTLDVPIGLGSHSREGVLVTDSPGLTAAKRLLDAAKTQGFRFERIAPGDDGPLVGRRDSADYKDEIYLGGFSDSCHATRARKYSLIVPGGLPVTARVSGDAVTVLHTVVTQWAST